MLVNLYDSTTGGTFDPYGGQGEKMANSTILPDVSEGVAEPSSSRMIIVIMFVGLAGLLAMYSNIFGWNEMPVIGEIVPLMENLGGSGIWYYLIGILVGTGMIISNLIGGVLSD